MDEKIELETFALHEPRFKFLTSEEYKEELLKIREKQKELIKIGMAAVCDYAQGWTVNNSISEGKKMVDDMKKLLLRSFNNECDICVDSVRFSNIESCEKRVEKSFEQCNKLGRITHVRITGDYKNLKYKEMLLALEYQKEKEKEKEKLRALREEERERKS